MPPHTACPFFPCTPFVGRVLALVLTCWVLTSPLRASLQGIDPVYPGATRSEQANQSAFAALKADGSVVTWGDTNAGGDSTPVSNSLSGGVTDLFSSQRAFAALKADGSVVAWGNVSEGGDTGSLTNGELSSNVVRISATAGAFAALKKNGSVVTWGDPGSGGDSSPVSSNLSSVVQVFSTGSAFAALTTPAGSIVAWGNVSEGGDAPSGLFGVLNVTPNAFAFAALINDGSVVTWGESGAGGGVQIPGSFLQVFSTERAFAALGNNGSVVAWGDTNYGGDCSPVAPLLASGVTKIFSTQSAFAALKNDGTVVVWGHSTFYDINNPGSLAPTNLLTGVRTIVTTRGDFAAIRANGSVVAWGASAAGLPWSQPGITNQLTSGVTNIVATAAAFAALKTNGSLVVWGDTGYGGDASSVSNSIKSGVQQVFATDSAFAALKSDGTVVTWGNANEGGNSAAKLTGVSVLASPFVKIRGAVQTIDLSPLTNSTNGLLDNLSYSTNAISIPPLSTQPSPGLPVALSVTSGPATLSGSPAAGYKLTLTGTGSVTIAAQQPGDSTHRAAIGSTATFTVGKGTQRILFPGVPAPLTYTTGKGLNPFKITLPASNVGIRTSSAAGGNAVLTGNSLLMLGAGDAWITATNSGSSNYFPVGFTTNFTIAKGYQTIALPAIAKHTFAASLAGNTFTIALPRKSSVGQLVSNSVSGPALLTPGGQIVATGAGTATLTASVSESANYRGTNVSETFVIQRGPQTIGVQPGVHGYTPGGAFPLVASAPGGAVTFSSGTPAVLTVSGATATIQAAGTAYVTASQVGNRDFLPASLTFKVVIAKGANPITFTTPATETYATNPILNTFPLVATAPGGAVTFSSSAPKVIAISGTNAIIKGIGKAVITASQTGGTNYLKATPVARQVVVTGSR
jgi:alpha-tubulin suppressor-like RCC1 family protein